MLEEDKAITFDQLRAEELRLRYLEMIDRPDVYPTRANWDFITRHAMLGLGPALYRKYLAALSYDEDDREELHQAAVDCFPDYLRAVPRPYAARTIYADLSTAPEAARALIEQCRLFDAPAIMELLDEGRLDDAMLAVDAYQDSYTAADIAHMHTLRDRLLSLPALGSQEQRRNLMGIASLRFICPEGHTNDPDEQYCTRCGKDIYGLTATQNARIDIFMRRLQALDNLTTSAQ